MYYDADGDLAHEFYEEVMGGLRRLTEGTFFCVFPLVSCLRQVLCKGALVEE